MWNIFHYILYYISIYSQYLDEICTLLFKMHKKHPNINWKNINLIQSQIKLYLDLKNGILWI